jgi:GT2 family glycosyltransferase
MNPEVYVVIPVRNRAQQTLGCLRALSQQTYHSSRIIVVDDGSSDATADRVRTGFPSTVVLLGDGNLWWTGATNLGLRFALEHAGKQAFILLLNNDITLEPDFLEVIVQFAIQHPRTLVGSVALSDDDKSTIVDGGVKINWRSAKYTALLAGENYQALLKQGLEAEAVDVLTGRGTLVPIEVFRKIGLYDQRRLPHYGADYEFSIRAKRAGFHLLVDYRSVALVNVKSTGIRNEEGAIRWGDLGKGYFSRRSPYSFRYRWNFARLVCPKPLLPTFLVLDTARVLLGPIRNQFMQGMG